MFLNLKYTDEYAHFSESFTNISEVSKSEQPTVIISAVGFVIFHMDTVPIPHRVKSDFRAWKEAGKKGGSKMSGWHPALLLSRTQNSTIVSTRGNDWTSKAKPHLSDQKTSHKVKTHDTSNWVLDSSRKGKQNVSRKKKYASYKSMWQLMGISLLSPARNCLSSHLQVQNSFWTSLSTSFSILLPLPEILSQQPFHCL